MKNRKLIFKITAINLDSKNEFIVNSHEKKHLAIIEMEKLFNSGIYNNLAVIDAQGAIITTRCRTSLSI